MKELIPIIIAAFLYLLIRLGIHFIKFTWVTIKFNDIKNKFYNWERLWHWYYGDSISAKIATLSVIVVEHGVFFIIATIFLLVLLMGIFGFITIFFV